MKYDFITKLETSSQDASYLVKRTKTEHLTYLKQKYVDSKYDPNKKRTEDFFAGIDKTVIKAIYNHYFMDFVMFNYTVDNFL